MKIAIIGNAGSGKTTVALQLHKLLNIPLLVNQLLINNCMFILCFDFVWGAVRIFGLICGMIKL
jgi:broad-specificity NMP kinase